VYQPIFVSGPHGSGKTTLLNKLLKDHDIFLENNFDIDFVTEFPTLESMSIYERCLLRLYHRIYVTNYAKSLAAQHTNRVVITPRGIYDSAAYIETYKSLQQFTSDNSEKLTFILNHAEVKPYTIVLNPPIEIVAERLLKRRNQGLRKSRDTIFIKEDSYEFVAKIWEYFYSLKNCDHVLYLEDNREQDIQKILDWIRTINYEKGVPS